MTSARLPTRLFAPALALGLCAFAVPAPASAQDATPSPTPARPPVTKPAPAAKAAQPGTPAPIVRATPGQTAAPPPAENAPKPIHLTVAKPVAKAPAQTGSPATNPDGTPAPKAATPKAAVPVAGPDGTPIPAPRPRPAAPKPAAPTINPDGSVTAPAAKPIAKAVPKPAVPKPSLPKAAPAPATPPGTASIPINRNMILLDASHGGGDAGSRISDQVAEKDVTLALAFKLRSLLTARGFTVVMTRDSDAAQSSPGTPLTLDDRAGIANRARPVACLLLHATASGEGVHLYSSELDALPAEPTVNPWLTAQAAWIPASQALVNQLGTALTRTRLPLVQSRASIRPVDSLTCPAVVLELAPESSGNTGSLTDDAYQKRVADAVAASLIFWQNQAQAPVRLVPLPPPPAAAPASKPAASGNEAQP